MMQRLFRVLLVLIPFLCLSAQVEAQATATVTGVVTDPSGSILVGASAVLTNPSTGAEYTATTNSAGSYRITNLPPGPGYTLVISHSGFNSYRVENVYVNVANVATHNATLNPGANVEISVSASGQGVTLNTEDATIGNNVQVEKLNELPVQNRLTPAVLFSLQPGITVTGATTGAREDQNYVTVDGLDVNDLATGQFGNITASAPVDSVQEFRGTVAGFTAATGAGGGGQFQLVTKSGTNEWHGQAGLYHRDNATMANDWFNNNTTPVTRAPKLVQNQFGGSLGGPIKRDRAFFFFDYTASRIARQTSVLRVVPLPSFQSGNVSYVNNNAGCGQGSRQNTTPNCISQLTPAQVKQIDPAGIGGSPALFNLLKRFPAPNDLTVGDGVNSGGFRFNAPAPNNSTSYVGKVDYNLTSKLKVWGRGTVARTDAVNTAAQFPGDPATVQQVDRSYAYAVGADWQISANKFNQFIYGTTVQDLSFQRPNNALGPNQVTFATGTTTLFALPYSSPANSQTRHIPIPVVQDNFNWSLGRHSVTLGGSFKWINADSRTVLDYNTYTLGLGGNLQGLNTALRPTNLFSSSATRVQYDSALAAALGRVGSASANFNYNTTGTALPLGTGSIRNYRYYQTQVYASDTWKVTPHFTLTYGLNYQYYSVPYEKNGLETAQSSLVFDDYIAARVAQSAAGGTAPNGLPFLTYQLGGPKNNGPALYNRDPTNFAPKFAFAWNPSFDSSTVFSGGIGTVYDRTIVNAVQYQQDQYSYLFFQPYLQNYGDSKDPAGSLQTNARYDNPPGVAAPATPKAPYTPYVTAAGNPVGLAQGQFNEMIDPHLKTPYSILANFGIQHQFPGAMILKVSWVGRYGRRLLAQADANQLIEFRDPKSGQLMSDAVANVTKAIRAGADPTNLPAQPWFENLIPAGSAGTVNGYPNNTSDIADNLGSLIGKGDFADTIQALAQAYNLPYNVGMGSQFGANSVFTNKGFSSYNGLLVSVQKNTTHGLAFDVNYTWAHATDNTSLTGNEQAIGGYGFICDVLRPRLCRANSDFDVTHYITGYAVYSLPFGRGRTFGSSLPRALDEVIGGWDLSNIFSWHSGNAWSTVSSAFVAGFSNNAPGIFVGNPSDVQRKVQKTAGGTLNLFADPTRAANAFVGPIGFEIGPRNSLRGPQYFNLDTGLAKTFTVVPEWGLKVQLRGDAFNILNHPNFAAPVNNSNYDDITQPSNFGQLTSTINSTGTSVTNSSTNLASRVVQISARVQF